MNKFTLGFIVVAVLALSLSAAGVVYAQAATPTPGSAGGMMGNRNGRGGGMMGGGAGRGGMMTTGAGWMHAEVVASFAEALGISEEDLNARLTAGETLWQVASAAGMSADEFTATMTEARAAALAQAVADGQLTQEQADWMNQRGGQMSGRAANADCPFAPTAQP